MPYIDKSDRRHYAVKAEELAYIITTPGELNFTITSILFEYLAKRGQSYSVYNELIGVLECVKQEFYRRAVAPYEDNKKLENGDVF